MDKSYGRLKINEEYLTVYFGSWHDPIMWFTFVGSLHCSKKFLSKYPGFPFSPIKRKRASPKKMFAPKRYLMVRAWPQVPHS